jgi:hypothetical protein
MALPGLPATRRGMQERAAAEGWDHPEAEGKGWRRREGRGGGRLFHINNLPMAARAVISRRHGANAPPPSLRDAEQARMTREEAWRFFERAPDRKKAVAKARMQALMAVQQLIAVGQFKVPAMQMVATQERVSLSTLYAWEALVKGVQRHDWLAYLIPRYAGTKGLRAEADPEALRHLRSFWLSSSKPTIEAAIRDTRDEARVRGWALPSDRTLARVIKAIDPVTAAWHREGPEAVDRMFPALRRDRSALHALEMVNADGHRFDVMCEWPDGVRARPVAVVFQDIFSGKLLSWRVDRSENTDAFRLAFGDVVEAYGIPDHLFVDNTLAAANKTMSGGVQRRFRFKVRDEEPLGILPSLGVAVHFTKPYHGQSKPIERAFRDLAMDVSRHPAFEGAYLGNSPENKPHDAGSRAVPIAEFLAVLEQGIAGHNARPGRAAPACRGRSFDETFAESYRSALIRKASAEQRRMFLLAAESVTVRMDATIHLLGNRYHHEALVPLIGAAVVVRFDPDRLHAPVHVCRWDGDLVCIADCVADVGFADTEAARRIEQARKQRRRAARLLAEAEKTYDAEDLARRARARTLTEPAPPEAKVVRPIFRAAGAATLKAAPAPDESALEAAQEARDRRLVEALRLTPPALRLVPDD